VRTEGIEGVNGVSAELKAVLGGSEGDRGSGSWWLNDGKHSGTVAVKEVEEQKGRSTGGEGCSFYSWRRRLAKAAQDAAGQWQ
jgi:hypothetical protein